jgi:hypothetical protein
MDNDPYVIENVITDRVIRAFVPGVAFNLLPQDHYD